MASQGGEAGSWQGKTPVLALGVFLVVSFLPAFSGYFFRPGDWYQALVKPPLNPPNWIFGPVWTLLYVTMGVSSWLVWRGRGEGPTYPALVLFAIQLLFNGLWTCLFFGLKNPALALIDILLLWGAIIATIWAFHRVSKAASLLLIPYLSWVSFATYLNFELWRLNLPSP